MLDPNQIRQAREALSLSQRELARRAGISRTALNQLEQSKAMPGPYFSRKLRDYFESAGINITAPALITTPPRTLLPEADSGHLIGDAEEHDSTSTLCESDNDGLPGYVLALLGLGLSIALGRSVGG